jgi:glucan phosphoethanolaminetransferase (alkaline phosphatase superfamily)
MSDSEITGPRTPFVWSVVIAGALAAWAVSFIFISLGSGVGLAISSPYSGPSSTTMTITGAIWLIITQTAAYATGGYLAARLRIRDHIPGPETMFRDAAHGFMVWVVGVAIMAIVIAIAAAFAPPSGSSGQPLSDAARAAAAYLSFWSFMALLFGAVAATLAGILGGELRDEEPEVTSGGRRKNAVRAS